MAIALVCPGCGSRATEDNLQPYACPLSHEVGPEHILTRSIDVDVLREETDWKALFESRDEDNPFIKYRRLFYAYRMARRKGVSDEAYVSLVRALDDAVAEVDGKGFRETPFFPSVALGEALGFDPEVAPWIKNETINVSGSHKGRHLMGIMIWLKLFPEANPVSESAPLAIASCGNAALGAAVVAKAGGMPLEVYVPPDANPKLLSMLSDLGARLSPCPREGDVAGDPCMHRFEEAVASGSLPFTVQGPRNALCLEGGLTLGYEMAAELARTGTELDALCIQVGGGALASSTVRGLMEARDLGVIARVPRVYLVQTESAYPLKRAYDRFVDRLLGEDSSEIGPDESLKSAQERAEAVSKLPREELEAAFDYAAKHRSEFMWPWETEPKSIATGILDDETYDWLWDLKAITYTGGFPLSAPEHSLERANKLTLASASISADHTGSAGLGALIRLCKLDPADQANHLAVLITGALR